MLDPEGKKIMASCFDPNFGSKDSIGWCATCEPDAKKGERGFCGHGETKREEAPIIYPNSTNWGFCNTDCNRRYGDESFMQAREHFISIRHLKIQIFSYMNIRIPRDNTQQTPLLMHFFFTWTSLTHFSKRFPFLTYYVLRNKKSFTNTHFT